MKEEGILGAVAVVALGGEDGLGDLDSLLGGDESDDVGETRVGRLDGAARSQSGSVSSLSALEVEGEAHWVTPMPPPTVTLNPTSSLSASRMAM